MDRLKPQLVHSLANGELYCSCLVNIYADPNYHNLTHWGVIQTLARRGVYVTEPKDVSLTETVLLQTSPIRMVRQFTSSGTHVMLFGFTCFLEMIAWIWKSWKQNNQMP